MWGYASSKRTETDHVFAVGNGLCLTIRSIQAWPGFVEEWETTPTKLPGWKMSRQRLRGACCPGVDSRHHKKLNTTQIQMGAQLVTI